MENDPAWVGVKIVFVSKISERQLFNILVNKFPKQLSNVIGLYELGSDLSPFFLQIGSIIPVNHDSGTTPFSNMRLNFQLTMGPSGQHYL